MKDSDVPSLHASNHDQNPEVDHVVINSLHDLDSAAELFSRLGFIVGERGYHSLGSMNHLIMTKDAYVELVGVPRDGLQRADVLNSPLGLSGLVFKSRSAQETYDQLGAEGLNILPPLSFSRPVQVDGQTFEAKFKIVRCAREIFPAGRVYICEHLTPELVWSGRGITHPNGFKRIVDITIHTTNLERDGCFYAAASRSIAERDGTGKILRLGPTAVKVVPDESDRFASLTLEFDSLAFIEEAAQRMREVSWERNSSHQGTLTVSAWALQIVCISDVSME